MTLNGHYAIHCTKQNMRLSEHTTKIVMKVTYTALILFIQTLALYKSFTYLLTYLLTYVIGREIAQGL